MQAKSHKNFSGQASSTDTNLVSLQAMCLQEISGLTLENLAQIFGVLPATYYKWISGSLLPDTHREHLLEILPLVEEATKRLGGPNATSAWLL